ncbi:hypothetical protein ACEPAF_3393 [Sanghuangporus sanghuang]
MNIATDDTSSSALPLGKYLASTDKKTRDKAVKNLAAFLSTPAQNAFSKYEMAKLWKGIFYCYWMSDKPLVQQALASELADVLLEISSLEASLAFLRGFWEAVVREWNGIDRLRMDKYYMLMRKFVNASFRLLIRNKWDKNAVTEYNDILSCRGRPLCPYDNRIPTSLSLHLADIYLVELDKAIASFDSTSNSDDLRPVPILSLLHPFLDLASRTTSNVTYQRIFDEVFHPLFLALKPRQSTSPEPPQKKRPRLETDPAFENVIVNSCLEDSAEEDKVDKDQLRKALLRRMFDVASESDARESNRRKMHTVWKAAMAEEGDEGGSDGQD